MKWPNCLDHNLLFGKAARRWLLLLGWLCVLAALWLVVLPWLGTYPPLRSRMDREQSQGINPGAMFWTELEAMPKILDRVDGQR